MAKEIIDPAAKLTAKSWFVYVVLCTDESYYCGITTDIERRIKQHNNGTGAKYTRSKGPVKLLKYWIHPDRSSASKAEHQFKRLRRSAKEIIIQQD